MIWDCFLFHSEIETLEIRLNVLKEVVDQFVLVEATKTFSGKPKLLLFQRFEEILGKFKDQIIHVVVTDMPDGGSHWSREAWQRNSIMRGLEKADGEDLILISDIDEIPNPLKLHKYDGAIRSFRQRNYCYYLNCITNVPWIGTVAVKRRLLEEPQLFRELKEGLVKIQGGGWHFSYLGGAKRIRQKIESFSHQEFDEEEFKSLSVLEEKIKKGRDLFNRKGYKYRFIDVDPQWPEYLLYNQEKFKNLIKK